MKLFEPGICYWATKNPCTDCRDKSKCIECDKSCEYVLAIHNEIIKEIKKNEEQSLEKIRKEIAEKYKIPYTLLFGKEE